MPDVIVATDCQTDLIGDAGYDALCQEREFVLVYGTEERPASPEHIADYVQRVGEEESARFPYRGAQVIPQGSHGTIVWGHSGSSWFCFVEGGCQPVVYAWNQMALYGGRDYEIVRAQVHLAALARNQGYSRRIRLRTDQWLCIGDNWVWGRAGNRFRHEWKSEAPPEFEVAYAWSRYRICLGEHFMGAHTEWYAQNLRRNWGRPDQGQLGWSRKRASRSSRKRVTGRWQRLPDSRDSMGTQGGHELQVNCRRRSDPGIWLVGFELEATDGPEFVEELPGLHFRGDGSVNNRGLEWITEEPWSAEDFLLRLDEILCTLSWEIDRSCGGHVHVSGWRQDLTPVSTVSLLASGPGLAFSDYGDIDRSNYARTPSLGDYRMLYDADPYIDSQGINRYRAVNLTSLPVHGTVEFRFWAGFECMEDIAQKVLASLALTRLADKLGSGGVRTFSREFKQGILNSPAGARMQTDRLRQAMMSRLNSDQQAYLDRNECWRVGALMRRPDQLHRLAIRWDRHGNLFTLPEPPIGSMTKGLYNVRNRRVRG